MLITDLVGASIDSNVLASIPIHNSPYKIKFRIPGNKPTSAVVQKKRLIVLRSEISFSNEKYKACTLSNSSGDIEEEERNGSGGLFGL